MGDDAMEIWKREIAAADARAAAVPSPAGPPVSQPPPGTPSSGGQGAFYGRPASAFTPPIRLKLGGTEKAILRLVVPMLIGAAYAALLLVTVDTLEINTAMVALPLLLGAVAALASGRSGAGIVAWSVSCWLAAIAVYMTIAPVLIVLDFVDCWLSWLSDC